MKFKDSISLEGVRPEILQIIPDVEELFDQTGLGLTITCTTGGHPTVDPHSFGFAIDCRTHGLAPIAQEALRDDIQHKLGPESARQTGHPEKTARYRQKA